MNTAAPLLLPLLRSRAQGDLMAWLFLYPQRPVVLSDLADQVGVSVAAVGREVNRLAEAGLLVEERCGQARLVRVDTRSALFQPLADLLRVTFGPVPVLTQHLGEVPGITEAFIYGSWAARYAGHRGDVPRDLDVLVVGVTDPVLLHDAADRAERVLRREVNVRRCSRGAWDKPADNAFLTGVRSRPLVRLRLHARSNTAHG